ncbi:MAG: winged helix-turn-helix transcriptional regulator [Promethearchaeota archaeon]|nr:MAG: winged helix-turn-helix transcriptional regulator [Candidatus Lokiarchaeota archaeon]
MGSFRGVKRKIYRYSTLILFIIFIGFNSFLLIANARRETITGFSIQDTIYAKEKVSYYFNNSLTFQISTDIQIDLSIEYENNIENRQTFFIINNSNPISLNVSSKANLQSFGVIQPPQEPKRGNFRYQYRYNCIYQVISNTSIENLTIQYKKLQYYGLNPESSFSLAIYESNQDSWELIETIELVNETSSEKYLESSLTNLQQDTEYYITIFEIGIVQEDWIWLMVLISFIAIGIISLVVLISKKDYFRYLRTRTVPIEKGAHRLSLDEVLENENRNRIIDLILDEPGIHFNELLRKTGLAAGNLVWHLDILLTYKVIGKKRIGNILAYFPYYQKNPISNVDITLQKSKLTLEILEIIEKDPGIWNSLITKKLKVDHKTILYHIKKLEELDLVHFEKDGRKKKIFPNLEADYFSQK